MKQWLKENIKLVTGLFLIWAVPVISLVIMAINGKTSGIKVKTWVIIVGVVMLFVYVIKGKKSLGKVKERQLITDRYVHWWIYLIEWIFIAIPFGLVWLLIENIKESASTQISQIELFLLICFISMSLGYFILISYSKDKEKEIK